MKQKLITTETFENAPCDFYRSNTLQSQIDIQPFKSKDPIKYMNDIGEIFYELELHCYGLIVWNGEGLYRIVEE